MTALAPAAGVGSMRVQHSSLEIARALDRPAPTPEQQAVIEAGPRPLLVVAGAGSGKTETMAARVVWLVANGLVEPDQVLGLTFTRKAATELAQRVTQRLRELVRVGLWTPPDDDGSGAEVLGGTPTVSTYHSYAGRLVREHALRVGLEPEFRVLTEAGAWQLAADAVARYDGPMDDVDWAESTIISAVMSLAGEMAEHLRTPAEVAAHLDEVIARLEALPDGAGRGSLAGIDGDKGVLATLRGRRAVTPIVERFTATKRSRDALDFADQVQVAARLASSVSHVGEVERQRFRAVLLDEYQDTSEAQLHLLRSLFAGGDDPVALTAVGDPNQSIYGWRGASATTLARFPAEFADPHGHATVLPLSTSWRNDQIILDTANITAAPLATEHVRPLSAWPGAGEGTVGVARLLSIEAEAAHVARWVAAGWRLPNGRRSGRSAAVLCRRRSHFPFVIDALRAQGLPVEVVGLGGLLMTPEVADLVSTLWVVNDPTRGDQLMRLLTGPVTRLGVADLDALSAWAGELARRPWRVGASASRQQLLALSLDDGDGGGPDDRAAWSESAAPRGADLAPDSADVPSLVEAIDELPRDGWTGPAGESLSGTARERLTTLAAVVRALRRLTGLPLIDLVGEAERAVGLDVEVLSRPEHTPSTARAHLDAFADVAAHYAMSSDRPTLSGFLSWLEAAREQERGLDAGLVETDSDAVQVLTVHAAKGLEWDLVAVPGLIDSVFPEHSCRSAAYADGDWVVSGSPSDKGWLTGLDSLPYDLRGDRDGLPSLPWRSVPDRRQLVRDIDTYAADGGRHGLAEERRLAYVAFTRARSALLLTTHWWGPTRAKVCVESRFMREVREALGTRIEVREWAAAPEPVRGPHGRWVSPDNPFRADARSALFPHNPMERRRLELADGVARVLARRAVLQEGGHATAAGPADPRRDELALLLAERAARRAPAQALVELPRHLSASAMVALARDPASFAMSLRRPMPAPPAAAARRGTAFHAWIEQHYASAAFVDLLDLPGSADESLDVPDEADPGGDLARLKELFLASEWANRIPEEIELAIETMVDGISLRGRIDAVFPRDDGGWTVVDWKSGVAPTGPDARVRVLQLGAYRLAFARLRGVDAAMVDAAFYYAAQGVTARPDVPGEAELVELLRTVPG